MLLHLATEEGKATAKTASQEKALTVLKKTLENNGIANPSQTLKEVRMLGLQLEQSHPELASRPLKNPALSV